MNIVDQNIFINMLDNELPFIKRKYKYNFSFMFTKFTYV